MQKGQHRSKKKNNKSREISQDFCPGLPGSQVTVLHYVILLLIQLPQTEACFVVSNIREGPQNTLFQLRGILFVPSITFLLSSACFWRFLFGTLRPHCALCPIGLPAPWPNLPLDPSTSEESSEQLDSGLIPTRPF